jgi:hypothetical protein
MAARERKHDAFHRIFGQWPSADYHWQKKKYAPLPTNAVCCGVLSRRPPFSTAFFTRHLTPFRKITPTEIYTSQRSKSSSDFSDAETKTDFLFRLMILLFSVCAHDPEEVTPLW